MNDHRTPEKVNKLLIFQEAQLHRRLQELNINASIIHTFRKNISNGIAAVDGTIEVKEFTDNHYILGEANDFTDCGSFYDLYIRFCRSADKNRINLKYPIGGYFNNINSFLKAPDWPERFYSQDPLGNNIIPAGKYLVGYVKAYYNNFKDLPQRMMAYAKEHGLNLYGPVYIVYLLDEISVIEPDQYLSGAMVSITDMK